MAGRTAKRTIIGCFIDGFAALGYWDVETGLRALILNRLVLFCQDIPRSQATLGLPLDFGYKK